MSENDQTPILLDITLPCSEERFILPTVKDAENWLNEFREDWEWAARSRGGPQYLRNFAQEIQNFISEVAQFLQSIKDAAGNHPRHQNALRDRFERAKTSAWILSADPEMQFVQETRKQDESMALVQLHYFKMGPIASNELNGHQFEAQLDAMIFRRKLADLSPSTKAALTKSVTAYEANLSQLREQKAKQDSEWKEQLTVIQSTLKEHSTNLQNLYDTRTTKLDDYLTESDSKIGAWKKAHREEINLKEPVTFWAKKQKNSLITAIILGIVFIAGLVVAGNILMAETKTIYEGLKVGDSIEYWRIAAMLLVGGLVFWFLRILSKIFLSQLHAWSDAQERVVMVRTYLSLLQDEKALDQNDRRLVLEALFRPAPSGIIKDDGVPPAVFEMISKLK